jgi:hypothetical protein
MQKNIKKENLIFHFDNFCLFLHLSKWNKIILNIINNGNLPNQNQTISTRSTTTLQLANRQKQNVTLPVSRRQNGELNVIKLRG